MNEETIKRNLERLEFCLESLPNPTMSEDENMWEIRNFWLLGIKNDLDEELKKIEKEKKDETRN